MRSAPAAITRALSFGHFFFGFTSRSRDSPKLAMARAAAPMFSPSCGSTSTMIGAGLSIQRLVLSVPAPGMDVSLARYTCPARFLLAHNLVRKPVSTFRDHALGKNAGNRGFRCLIRGAIGEI